MIKGIKPQLAEAGKIKIGGLGEKRTSKSGNEYRLPVKFDHFVITKTTRDQNGDLFIDADLMMELKPDKDQNIRAIPIVLHSDEIEEVFPTAYALYSGKKCHCRGNGETAIRREVIDDQYTNREKEISCPCDYLDGDGKYICKANGKLYCSIVAGSSAVAGAVHIWRTTSIISVQRMLGSLIQIKSICGTLRGIPLWLKIEPIAVDPSGQGSITVYCCHVELRAKDVLQVQERALQSMKLRDQLASPEYRGLLSAPGESETDEEQAEIAAEFYAEDKEPEKGTSASDISETLSNRSTEEPKQEKPEEEKPRSLF